MSYNGSGVFNLPSGNPVVTGTTISSTVHNNTMADVASGLSNALCKDGQSTPTANIKMGGFKFTGLAAGAGAGESARWEQLFDGGTEQVLASAATCDIGSLNTDFVNITGTTTITSFGTNYRGPRFLRFAGAVTLTNSSTLICPGNANITTAAGDCVVVMPKATAGVSDGWQIVGYQQASSNPTSPTFTNVTATNLTATNNINVPNTFGFKNRLINAQGLINQRTYVSGTATSGANQYTLDRWRVVTSGQNLTFTTTNNVTTFTAPAGGVEQVIEGLNLESGTYVLSWTGTATAKVAGATVANGGTVTVIGGTNTTVQFASGTFSLPQFEKGSTATSFDYRPYGTESALCQRYYYRVALPYNVWAGPAAINGTGAARGFLQFPITMRTAPTTLEQSGTAGDYAIWDAGTTVVCSAVPTFYTAGVQGGTISLTVASGLTAGHSGLFGGNAGAGYLGWSAEL